MEENIMNFLSEQVGSNGIFFALFIYLFYSTRKESKDRENLMQVELHKSQDLLTLMASKYDLIVGKIDELQSTIKSGKRNE